MNEAHHFSSAILRFVKMFPLQPFRVGIVKEILLYILLALNLFYCWQLCMSCFFSRKYGMLICIGLTGIALKCFFFPKQTHQMEDGRWMLRTKSDDNVTIIVVENHVTEKRIFPSYVNSVRVFINFNVFVCVCVCGWILLVELMSWAHQRKIPSAEWTEYMTI